MNNLQLKKERTEKILLSLDKLDYLSREQIQVLHDLGSNRNACRVLKDMEEYLHVVRNDENMNVYYLNKQGREKIGSTKVRKKTLHLEHFLMRNDAYIYYGCPAQWFPEQPVKVAGMKEKIIPDAVFHTGMYKFLEVDHTQKMSNNKVKLEKYKQLKDTGSFQKQYNYFPTIVFITTTQDRKKKLKEYADRLDVFVEIHTKQDIR